MSLKIDTSARIAENANNNEDLRGFGAGCLSDLEIPHSPANPSVGCANFFSGELGGAMEMNETFGLGSQEILIGRGQNINLLTADNTDLRDTAMAFETLPVGMNSGLGSGLHTHDLRISPYRRILLHSRIMETQTGQSESSVAARKLTLLLRVYFDWDAEAVEYFHILLDDHSVMNAEGVPAKNLLLGGQALKVMTPDAKADPTTLLREVSGALQSDQLRYPEIHKDAAVASLIGRHLNRNLPLTNAVLFSARNTETGQHLHAVV